MTSTLNKEIGLADISTRRDRILVRTASKRNNSMNRVTLVTISLASMLTMQASADINLTADSLSYSQDFDGLTRSGTETKWVDNLDSDTAFSLNGWHAAYENGKPVYIRASNGGSTGGRLYSYGIRQASSERALGSLPTSGKTKDVMFGVAFVNKTEGRLSEIRISYDGEQWREGSSKNNILKLSYQIFSPEKGSINAKSGWIEFNKSAHFNSPKDGGNSEKQNGNYKKNRVANISVKANNIKWNAGDELWIRFYDNDSPTTDHGMAVDNFNFTAKGD